MDIDQSESPEEQIQRLADFIMAEVPGEPSQSEGAVDVAIRLLRGVYATGAAQVTKGGDPSS